MKYQLAIVEDKEGKIISRTELKTHIEVRDAGYWQRRINELIAGYKLNERAVVQVAK